MKILFQPYIIVSESGGITELEKHTPNYHILRRILRYLNFIYPPFPFITEPRIFWSNIHPKKILWINSQYICTEIQQIKEYILTMLTLICWPIGIVCLLDSPASATLQFKIHQPIIFHLEVRNPSIYCVCHSPLYTGYNFCPFFILRYLQKIFIFLSPTIGRFPKGTYIIA